MLYSLPCLKYKLSLSSLIIYLELEQIEIVFWPHCILFLTHKHLNECIGANQKLNIVNIAGDDILWTCWKTVVFSLTHQESPSTRSTLLGVIICDDLRFCGHVVTRSRYVLTNMHANSMPFAAIQTVFKATHYSNITYSSRLS